MVARRLGRTSRLAIKTREHPRRHAKKIEEHAAEIAQAPRKVAFAAIALSARDRARFQHRELPTLEPAHQIHVLHQRQRAEAAQAIIEVPRDEEPLISVRQSEQLAAETNQPLDEARHDAIIIEREAERRRSLSAPAALHPFDEVLRLLSPARLEHRVGVEKEQ